MWNRHLACQVGQASCLSSGTDILPVKWNRHLACQVEQTSCLSSGTDILPVKWDRHLACQVEQTSCLSSGTDILPVKWNRHLACQVGQASCLSLLSKIRAHVARATDLDTYQLIDLMIPLGTFQPASSVLNSSKRRMKKNHPTPKIK